MGRAGTFGMLLSSLSNLRRIALGVAGRPITGLFPFRMYELLVWSAVWLLMGMSLGAVKVVWGSSKTLGDRATMGESSSGCGIGGAEGRRARDLRRSSSSRAAASFLACLSAIIFFRSPARDVLLSL